LTNIPKRWKILLAVALFGTICYVFLGKYRISRYVAARQAITANTDQFTDGRSELGVVVGEHVDDDYWRGTRQIHWAVKVPYWPVKFPSNRLTMTYHCTWSEGSAEFTVGEAVRLTHAEGFDDDDSSPEVWTPALLVSAERGLSSRNKRAYIDVADTDELYLLQTLDERPASP